MYHYLTHALRKDSSQKRDQNLELKNRDIMKERLAVLSYFVQKSDSEIRCYHGLSHGLFSSGGFGLLPAVLPSYGFYLC